MSTRSDYIALYAEAAMEQQRLYGIPASVTLAQALIESANGQSCLAQQGNNHFGIKASQSWIDGGGRYGLHSDDKPNEKFCYYDSVADSYTHHSQFLKDNSRYSACFNLAADDYKGWANGLQQAGYASSKQYASTLISVIESNNLQRFDQQVIEEMAAQGLTPGQGQPKASEAYSFPLKRNEFLFVTSPFGNRVDPMDSTKTQFHKGIDIKCDNEALLATENGGKVVASNDNANTPAGKSVTIEYEREDGSKVQVYYAHLSAVNVKVGDTVNAGQRIGVSGNTGTRTTGPHLHFGVKQIAEDGTKRDIDPAAYLAKVALKGNISLTAMYNGSDLLAKYKTDTPDEDLTESLDTSLSAEDWMKKLLCSEDSGIGMSSDPVMDMVVTMFTSLMALAVQIDNKSEEEAKQAATDAALNREIDLSSLTPNLRSCSLQIRDGAMPILHIQDATSRYSIELTQSDLNRLNLALASENKQERVAAIISNLAVNAQMSQSYQRGMATNQSEQLSIK